MELINSCDNPRRPGAVVGSRKMHCVASRLLATSPSGATTSGKVPLDVALSLGTAISRAKVPVHCIGTCEHAY